MIKTAFATLFLFLTACSPVLAQPRPGAFTTVVTTSTGTKSVCAGANTINSPATCTGEVSGGNVAAAGTVTATGNLTVGGAANEVSASSATSVLLRIRNTNTGTGALAALELGNNATSSAGDLYAFGSNYTTSGRFVQDSILLDSVRAGGLGLSASEAAGTIRFYTGGGTQRWVIGTSGNLNPFADATYNIGGTANTVARVFMSGGTNAAPSLVVGGGTSDTGLFFGAGTSGHVSVALNGLDVAQFLNSSSTSLGRGLYIKDYNASTREGGTLSLGRNISGTGAGGQVAFTRLGGTIDYVWSDNTGVLRTHTTAPLSSTAGSDTAGTIVGTQTSTRASKHMFGRETNTKRALQTILKTPVYRFEYKSGAYSKTRFVGITTDESPQFGMDEGKSFNPVSAHGYTVLAIQELQKEIEALKKELANLKQRQKAVGF